jgi:YHS domain-containing protein
MRKQVLFAAGAALLVMLATAIAEDAIKLDGINCLVAGSKPAKAENSVEYKGAKVFFCCMKCPKTFAADTAKFAAKANHQLVATKQATQKACPFSGQPVTAGTEIKVGNVEVGFCCEMCQGKAKAEKDQVALIFSDAAFEKGFKVGK